MDILFIDDDSLAFDFVHQLLKAKNRVMVATNLADAEDLLIDAPGIAAFDVILLDLDMDSRLLPEELREKNMMAGWVFYEHFVKKLEGFKNKVIFISGYISRLRDEVEPELLSNLYIINKLDSNKDKTLLNIFEEIINTRRM